MNKFTGILWVCLLALAGFAAQAAPYTTATYYGLDATDSPVVAMNQAGTVIWRKTYAPYGKASNKDQDNRIGYTGHVENANGLVDAGARHYDPALGVFTSDDPVRFNENNPASFNRYGYANNNPYKFVDPDGKDAVVGNVSFSYGNLPNSGVDQKAADGVTGLYLTVLATTAIAGIEGAAAAVGLSEALYAVSGGDMGGASVSTATKETIVIGEGMADRVIPTAKARGAGWYDPPSAPPEKWMENNQKWINEKMNQGCRILDCGAAPGRTNFPDPTSSYYKMEREQIDRRNYSSYERIGAEGE